jgi:hypothetical protein
MISIQARFLGSHAGLVATASPPIPATGTNLLTTKPNHPRGKGCGRARE